MVKAKAKSGIGKGTDKKGWNRWQASARRKRKVRNHTKVKERKNSTNE